MKLRKILSGISALCFIALSSILIQVQASGSATTTLTVTIPDTHSVQLMIGNHGAVSVNGTEYRRNQTIAVARLVKQEYNVQADEGWQIKSVKYAGEEQKNNNDKHTKLTFTAPAINEDGLQLVVTLEEDKSYKGKNVSTTTTKAKPQLLNNSGKGGIVKTGDTSNFLFYGVLLVLASGAIILMKKNMKEDKTQRRIN